MDFSVDLSGDLVAVFITLFVLELVLGVDNVIFISILASKLPRELQAKARNLGLTLAMLIRVGLVFLAGWIITLTQPWVTLWGREFSAKDFILIVGGLFLVYKAVHEIHHKLEGVEEEHGESHGATAAGKAVNATFGSVIAQILVLDIVFSLDSVITAVGMTSNMVVIVTAVVLSFGIMLFASRFIFEFVNAHPTVKMLALAFLLLIGVFLIAEGFHYKIDKAFIYGPMAFAIFVEGLNLTAAKRKARRDQARRAPVRLRPTYPAVDAAPVVASALSREPGSGAVGLSRRPVLGEEGTGADHPGPQSNG